MSWKTTLCGLLAIVGGILIKFYPEYSRHGEALVALASGLGLLFARDNNKTSEQVGAGPSQSAKQNFVLFALLCFAIGALFALVGCARFNSKQIEKRQDGTTIESHQTITTFFDAQSSVAKLHASTTDKTQGLTVGSVNEAAEGTNATALLSSAVGAAVTAAVGAAK